ncbi:MAG: helix-turn-helix domain-containing protein, partial [Pseudomonadota bacterium]
VSVSDGEPPCMGFVIRSVGGRLKGDISPRGALPDAVEQMRDLVGRVPLKDLVRETTDIIERMCIEAALEITNDNRASAAEILGLSRQSLYVKLRRYGLDDTTAD